MSPIAWARVGLGFTLLLAGSLGCSEQGQGLPGVDAGLTGSDGATGGDGGGAGDSGGSASLVRVDVAPPSATLVVRNGNMPTQTFMATGVFSDGSMRTVVARYSSTPLEIGSVRDSTGVFTANGLFGGTATVRATVRDGVREVSGEATVTVRLEETLIPAGTASTAPNLFVPASAIMDPARAPGLVYPLDGAVMPENVYPPDVQWENGSAGDIIQISLERPSIAVRAYVTMASAADAHWQVDEGAWRRLARTDRETPLTITLTRFEAATRALITERPITLKLARAALSGTIYYWDIVAGRIVRINDGTAVRDQFMPTPPLDCVGCHSVSSSGRYMAGRFGGGDNIAGVFDLTQNLSSNPPPMLYTVDSSTIRWWFSSWSPDDHRLIVTTDETGARAMRLVDPFAGVYLPTQGEPLPTSATHPAWAPDNGAIAYVGATNDWGGNNSAGSISIVPVTGQDTFGPSAAIHDGAALANAVPPGSADAYPTWTPDSNWIAFAHGDSSRSENGHSALYFMKRDGTGVVRMDKASGGPATANTFQPRMSPFKQGGYFWVSYLSSRDYGNASAGTKGTGRQQIWISGIKENPTLGEDPSEVGYWLPGQSTGSRNISAYWAPRACREAAQTCTSGAECCSGDCRADANNNLVCSPGGPAMCKEFGTSCQDSTECCDGIVCQAGMCGGV
ncbi:MAG: hypothetical protein U1E65_28290 [Myxococcota bacterium]